MEEKGKRKRRRFTPEYKAEAVRLVETSGRTCAEIARDLGIQPTEMGHAVTPALVAHRAKNDIWRRPSSCDGLGVRATAARAAGRPGAQGAFGGQSI